MAICQPHNLNRIPGTTRPYGIRVTLKRDTPFRLLLGADWQKLHWYETAADRDAALADMASQPEVYRLGDIADVVLEKVEASGETPSR